MADSTADRKAPSGGAAPGRPDKQSETASHAPGSVSGEAQPLPDDGQGNDPRGGQVPSSAPTAPERRLPTEQGHEESPGLGFGLSFIQGRALIGFGRRRINPWLSARNLCLEVPDIRFPFDVSAGAETFRNRRCRLVSLAFEAEEEGLTHWLLEYLSPVLAEQSGIGGVEIRFAEGFVEVAGTVPAGLLDETGGDHGGAGTLVPFTLKIAVDASAEKEVRLLLHDCRIYAPSSLPAPAIGMAFLSAVQSAEIPVVVEQPATLRLDLLSPYLRKLLPRPGWKLPDMDHARLSSAVLEPGRIRLDL
ncbi:MAG: hypothetical protein ACOCVR_04425, partial [Myxococcota bacterium]